MDSTEIILEKIAELSNRVTAGHATMAEKLEKLDDRLDQLNIISAVQGTELDHYTKRLEVVEKKSSSLQDQIEPLKANVQKWAGVGRGLTFLGVLVGIGTSVYKIWMP